jgi:hypothetical protein
MIVRRKSLECSTILASSPWRMAMVPRAEQLNKTSKGKVIESSDCYQGLVVATVVELVKRSISRSQQSRCTMLKAVLVLVRM